MKDWRTRTFCPQGHDTTVVGRTVRSRFCKTCAAAYQRSRRVIINARARAKRNSPRKPAMTDAERKVAHSQARKKDYAKNRLHRVAYSAARQRGLQSITANGAAAVTDYYGQRCVYCGRDATGFDHLHPVIKGGTEGLLNLAPCCKSCNSRKRDRPIWSMLNALGGDMSPWQSIHTTIR